MAEWKLLSVACEADLNSLAVMHFDQVQFSCCFLGGTMWPSWWCWQYSKHWLQILAECYSACTELTALYNQNRSYTAAVTLIIPALSFTLLLWSSQHPSINANSVWWETAHIYEKSAFLFTLLRSTWVLSCPPPFLAGSVAGGGWGDVADPAGQ